MLGQLSFAVGIFFNLLHILYFDQQYLFVYSWWLKNITWAFGYEKLLVGVVVVVGFLVLSPKHDQTETTKRCDTKTCCEILT